MSSATPGFPSRLKTCAHSGLRHEIDGRVEEDEEHRQEKDAHDGGDPRRILNGFGPRAEDRLGDVDVRELFGAAAPPQHAGDVEGGDRENDADHHEVAEVDAVEGGCGDRAGVRRHEDVHHGEGDGRGEGVEQDGPAQPLGDGEDDGQHDHEAGVEEHGEAQQKGGEAERHGGALLTEFSDHVVGEHLGAAGMFDQHAQHCAEAHQYSDAAQRRIEPFHDGVVKLVERDSRGDGGHDRDDDERDEGVKLKCDDEEKDDGDRCGRDREQGCRRDAADPGAAFVDEYPFVIGQYGCCWFHVCLR